LFCVGSIEHVPVQRKALSSRTVEALSEANGERSQSAWQSRTTRFLASPCGLLEMTMRTVNVQSDALRPLFNDNRSVRLGTTLSYPGTARVVPNITRSR